MTPCIIKLLIIIKNTEANNLTCTLLNRYQQLTTIKHAQHDCKSQKIKLQQLND